MSAQGKISRFLAIPKLPKIPIGYFRFCYMICSFNFMSEIRGLCDIQDQKVMSTRDYTLSRGGDCIFDQRITTH
jgi:hypothetical protein